VSTVVLARIRRPVTQPIAVPGAAPASTCSALSLKVHWNGPPLSAMPVTCMNGRVLAVW
jgi:hypothetical protein